ncbi:MAG: amino acid adenylation domain-containing protein, partial [Chloroflexi bacterium]|nr:amino acid adenylation domain-containing protein [Chloroflexota bacterium]
RAQVLRLGQDDYLVLWTMHHIISDGWSLGVFLREIVALYQAFAAGQPSLLPELPIQYADYAAWQRGWLVGEALEGQLDYWRKQLAGLPPLLELPTDRPRPAVQSYRGATVTFDVPEEIARGLQGVSREAGATLFMTLLAAFQVLLSRYSGQDDLAVGTPIANRTRAEIEGLIGFFVNTLVLRGDLSGNPSFVELLRRVREAALGAYAHQDVPFEMVVDAVQPQRNTSHSPLFQVMFVLQNNPLRVQDMEGLTLEPVAADAGIAQFDLTLLMQEQGPHLSGELQYNTDLYDRERIERMAAHFQTLLAGIVADSAQPVATLPLLTDAERTQIVDTWNDTAAEFPAERCAHELFEGQAARQPDAVAVEFEGETLTYAELNRRANQLARYLRRLGVGPEVLVGLCVDRSPDAVVGMLGVHKAGGAYVPMDPDYPPERLAYMLADAQAAVLLTQERVLERLPGYGGHMVRLDADWPTIAQEADGNLDNWAVPDNLAYVIYTSGSTGRPKGVQLMHRGLVNLAAVVANQFAITAESRVLQFASLSFDASVSEVWPPLLQGARLYLARREMLLSGGDLLALLQGEGITVVTLPPSLLSVLPAEELPALRTLVSAGEACPVEVARRWSAGRCFLNGYGPTETTVAASYYRVESVPEGTMTIPIGKPIANGRLYVLDAQLQPVPVGVAGELYVGGVNVGRGYLNRPDLTAERFVPDPFGGEAGARLYRTGDLARYLPDGNLEFLGRIDHQVKVRGFRIELGEIETALRELAGVRDVAVVVREDEPGQKRLMAYLVPEGDAPSVGELRALLGQLLPEYMVPSAYVFLDVLPLTPNGKIDRKALPAPEATRQEAEQTFVAPRDELEHQLARIWEELLGVAPVGVTDNFFDLGGHSLLAVRLMAQVEERLGKKLPLLALFQGATVEQLANYLREQEYPRAIPSLVPLKPEGSRPPLFFIHPSGGSVHWYFDLARHLDREQPFYGLQAQGLEADRPLLNRIEDMAAHYVGEMRSVQPAGPYYVGSWSMGVVIALEMAQQLVAQGEQVALLAMLDQGPDIPGPELHDEAEYLQAFFGKQVSLSLDVLRQMTPDDQVAYVLEKLREAKWVSPDITLSQFRHFVYLLKSHAQAWRQYEPKVYPGRITVFRTKHQPPECSQEPDLGWGRLAAGGVDIEQVRGDHNSMLHPPHVRSFAKKLEAYLRRAREGNGR